MSAPPIMPFSGVRSSWVMLARKAVWVAFACSAASNARRNRSEAAFSSVTSSASAMTWRGPRSSWVVLSLTL